MSERPFGRKPTHENILAVETPTFTLDAKELWSEEDRGAFCAWLATHPDAGDVIPGSGGCRKVRWRQQGAGKSDGLRVIIAINKYMALT